jgi:hypothetical protein
MNPAGAFMTDNLYARDFKSGTDNSSDCNGAGKDSHNYFDYDITIPGGAAIKGIEIRLDARTDSAAGTPQMCVQLSWDGGLSWTATQSTPTLSNVETTTILGGATDTWGRAWNAVELSNANFRVRVINVSTDPLRDFALDLIGVRIRYQTGQQAANTTTLPALGVLPGVLIGAIGVRRRRQWNNSVLA